MTAATERTKYEREELRRRSHGSLERLLGLVKLELRYSRLLEELANLNLPAAKAEFDRRCRDDAGEGAAALEAAPRPARVHAEGGSSGRLQGAGGNPEGAGDPPGVEAQAGAQAQGAREAGGMTPDLAHELLARDVSVGELARAPATRVPGVRARRLEACITATRTKWFA